RSDRARREPPSPAPPAPPVPPGLPWNRSRSAHRGWSEDREASSLRAVAIACARGHYREPRWDCQLTGHPFERTERLRDRGRCWTRFSRGRGTALDDPRRPGGQLRPPVSEHVVPFAEPL